MKRSNPTSAGQNRPATVPPSAAAHPSPNRLAREKSPYLLQHQHNPVDWFPWGEDAFARARDEQKPIFLSIGYSTCHWCHVMERESFEDETVAAFLNAHFVAIKVDREERPDVDKIYMTFVQAMTGQGGWPLNVFLTPERQPFYGGTYWPPEGRHGRAGFLTILKQVHQAWQDKREQITASAREMHQRLEAVMTRASTGADLPGPETMAQTGAQLKHGYDAVHGGWGSAPKFPMPSHPWFLLWYGAQFHDPEATRMVLHTSDRMAQGGICDQLGGGFHRYSVDEHWLVPHFEKMLYDNAQLLGLYLDCFLVSGEQRFAEVAHGIIRYVLRDLSHPEGGFYSAEDADSEGKEGKFYCWTRAELSTRLTTGEFNAAVNYFGVTEQGNFVDHSDPDPLPGQNVLSAVNPKPEGATAVWLQSAIAKMIEIRSHRARPQLDDKVLASWNGLMLGTLARAYAVLNEPAYLAAAERNLAFLKSKLWDESSRTLFARWRDGERHPVQLIEAYAFLMSGALELYQVTLNPRHLEFAVALAEGMLRRFYDPADGGFYQSGLEAKDLILRVKEDYDGAEPSGNSVAVLGLLKLHAITGRREFREAADKTLRLFSDRLRQHPQAVPYLWAGLTFSMAEPRRVVLAGDVTSPESTALLMAAHAVYQPHKVVLGTLGPVEEFARRLPAPASQATLYCCTGTACQPPTRDAAQVRALLR